MVFRVYVEKKDGFDVSASQLAQELRNILGIKNLKSARLINRYDVDLIDEELFKKTIPTVFSEPQTDNAYLEMPEYGSNDTVFAVEFLPGQFDQRADSAGECIQLISRGQRPDVKSATVYILSAEDGKLSDEDIESVKSYVINPVEAREADLAIPETLETKAPAIGKVEIIEGFCDWSEDKLADFISERGLASDIADLIFCQKYFRDEEHRDPTITEIKVIDTYWSDHCRHTTFGTQLDNITIEDETVKEAFDKYLQMRKELGRESKPICLMDMGTIGAKYLKSKGILKNLDESEEINACTVKVKVDVDGKDEDWLFLFKNETHNHPTEIEPFGGAATCIGGCIRDPLSGRSYVYQAMRVTGAADPTVPVSETLEGKLPQRKLVTTAANGYSSYGNQIGLATGQVSEIYHPGYMAKRMEVGAVVAATPADHVRRETPAPGDKIILLGGRTGRDGIGGATGSSKSHNVKSLESDGAEVQKGNAPTERKLQRLFRRADACRLIKRCNDFGAGGVSVAAGEIADGLSIDLNAVTRKYDGLDGTELAISESQERMACDVAAEDADTFLQYAREENLEASVIATVTREARMRMTWNGDTIVDLSREFLSSNGAAKHQDAAVEKAGEYVSPWSSKAMPNASLKEKLVSVVSDLNVASNKGLSERFDSTIGAGTVLMPFGGRRQLSPAQAMVAKFPVETETRTASAMTWGFNPYIMEKNQFAGAYLSVIESISKLIAAGFSRKNAYLSFQEYFEKLRDVPTRWGKPVAAVLGALEAQIDCEAGAIGGKDSMSGSFEDLDVPPTLISFAVSTGCVENTVSTEFKKASNRIVRIAPKYRSNGLMPEAESQKKVFDIVEKLAKDGCVAAAATPGYGCAAYSIFSMCIGNKLGAKLENICEEKLFVPAYGSFILEISDNADIEAQIKETADTDGESFEFEVIGTVTDEYELSVKTENGEEKIDLTAIQEAWESSIEDVFPYRKAGEKVEAISYPKQGRRKCASLLTGAKPRVVIPVFPGNNCEFDTARAFALAGAETDTFVINNLTAETVAQSVNTLAKKINKSQIVMIPGGFSGGDEPDGSAKFIAAFFRAPQITEAVRDLINNRDGLMLGICNGFQALIKLGLVPFGDIIPADENSPTLTFNTIGRHQSRLINTRISSTKSAWLAKTQVGDIHTVAISHGEGRFVANDETLKSLIANGQVAAQYTDEFGIPSMDWNVNPNGSAAAIEAITSPDGRILGKMGHSERSGQNLYRNVPGNMHQPIFEAGVEYFTA